MCDVATGRARRPRAPHLGWWRPGIGRVLRDHRDRGLQQFGPVAAGLATDDHDARVEHDVQILDQYAEVTRRTFDASLGSQCPCTDECLGTTTPAAGTQLAVDLHDAVPDLAGHAPSAGEQMVVEHDTGANTDVAADEDQRAGVAGGGKLVFTQCRCVTVVLQMDVDHRNATARQCAVHHAMKGQVAPTQIGGKTDQIAGLVDRARQTDADTREQQAALAQIAPGGVHHLRHLLADGLGVCAVQCLFGRAEHHSGQRNGDQPHLPHADLDTHKNPALAVDVQGCGRPAHTIAGHRRVGFGDPAR